MSDYTPDSHNKERDDALRALYDTHSPTLRRYLKQHVREANDREDIEQDVYVKLAQTDAWRFADKPEALIITIARNLVIDQSRRNKVRFRSAHVELDAERDLDPAPNIENRVMDRAELRRIMAAISDLEEPGRTAFILHRFETMTYAQIAQHMQISVKTVEKYISACLMRLRTSLPTSVGEIDSDASASSGAISNAGKLERTTS